MAFMNARYAGTCKECSGAINVGDRIEWRKYRGAKHANGCDAGNGDVPTVETSPAQRKARGLCPTCGVTPLSWQQRKRGYQCDACADLDEGPGARSYGYGGYDFESEREFY